MKSDNRNFFVIFDTNTLYHPYDKKGDFTTFSFSKTYDNIIEMINQGDIYEYITLVIPSVVWNEMTEQIIESHDKALADIEEKFRKYNFPELDVRQNEISDYKSYIQPIIDKYKHDLSSDINKVIELPIASCARFNSIIDRAFNKNPPFEGKAKKSDKGFKDALLWESILEFTSKHRSANIIYYSKDNIFQEFLQQEFKQMYPESNLIICKSENEVREELNEWSKTIDQFRYQPIENVELEDPNLKWIKGSEFLFQLMQPQYGLVADSRFMRDTVLKLIEFDTPIFVDEQNETKTYSIRISVEIVYKLLDDNVIRKNIPAKIEFSVCNEEYFINKVEDLSLDENE